MIRFILTLTTVGFAFSPLCSGETVIKSREVNATLVELYSSEGCSSCPPAEAWISKLKNAPGLWTEFFPVVFHVDYWDGLGWPDRFAQASFTQRQRTYAQRLGQESVYTPEFVVNGRQWKGWFHGDQLSAADSASKGDLTLTVEAEVKKMSGSFNPSSGSASQPYTLNVALLGFHLITDVKRGENGGRQLEHDFVVLKFFSKSLAPVQGRGLQSGELAFGGLADRPGAVVAWVTEADGTIVQVAGGWLKPNAP